MIPSLMPLLMLILKVDVDFQMIKNYVPFRYSVSTSELKKTMTKFESGKEEEVGSIHGKEAGSVLTIHRVQLQDAGEYRSVTDGRERKSKDRLHEKVRKREQEKEITRERENKRKREQGRERTRERENTRKREQEKARTRERVNKRKREQEKERTRERENKRKREQEKE